VTQAERTFRVLPNDPSELRPLSRWALEVARGLDLHAGMCHDIDLCLHEAVSNIIRHGGAEPRQVTVRIERAETRILLEVEDDGPSFDPLAEPPPAEARTLAEARTGGYGIPLLRGLARQLRYERVDGRNRLSLLFDAGPEG
jgi:serine/threonine-protein kinase RsbW